MYVYQGFGRVSSPFFVQCFQVVATACVSVAQRLHPLDEVVARGTLLDRISPPSGCLTGSPLHSAGKWRHVDRHSLDHQLSAFALSSNGVAHHSPPDRGPGWRTCFLSPRNCRETGFGALVSRCHPGKGIRSGPTCRHVRSTSRST